MADAAAVPEPEIAPNSIFATTLVCASAPGALPVISFARLIRRMAMPPRFMILPARIKKGIASRAKTEIPEKIRCAPVTTAMSARSTGKMAQIEENPSAMDMGTPHKSRTNNRINIIRLHSKAISMIELLYFLRKARIFKIL